MLSIVSTLVGGSACNGVFLTCIENISTNTVVCLEYVTKRDFFLLYQMLWSKRIFEVFQRNIFEAVIFPVVNNRRSCSKMCAKDQHTYDTN